MTEKPKARLRPLKAEDVEIVASFERDIAKISFPDDPITDLTFYMKKVGKLSMTATPRLSSRTTAPARSAGPMSASGRISSPRSPTPTSIVSL
jgi:hypothetical protein